MSTSTTQNVTQWFLSAEIAMKEPDKKDITQMPFRALHPEEKINLTLRSILEKKRKKF